MAYHDFKTGDMVIADGEQVTIITTTQDREGNKMFTVGCRDDWADFYPEALTPCNEDNTMPNNDKFYTSLITNSTTFPLTFSNGNKVRYKFKELNTVALTILVNKLNEIQEQLYHEQIDGIEGSYRIDAVLDDLIEFQEEEKHHA